jgi:hypothetical protein
LLSSPARTVRVTAFGGLIDAPAVGNHLWFRDTGRTNVGILTQYSTNVAFQHAAMHFMSGFGVIAQFTENISYHNLTVETRNASGRFCASTADMLQCSGCAGLVNITASRFVGSQDDAINVHGTHLQVVAQPSPTTITVQFNQHESYGFKAFFPGDAIQFTRSDTLQGFGSGTVIKATMLENATQILLELSSPPRSTDGLGPIRLGVDVVENLKWCPDLLVESSYFSRIPTRGMLVTTRGTIVIRNNTIRVSNRALHVADDASSWYESGPVTDLLFANNTINILSTANARANGPVIDFSPSSTPNASVHKNIRITNNVVRMCNGSNSPVVSAKGVAGLTVAGNTVYSPGRPLGPGELVDVVSGCSGVQVFNNTVVTKSMPL